MSVACEFVFLCIAFLHTSLLDTASLLYQLS